MFFVGARGLSKSSSSLSLIPACDGRIRSHRQAIQISNLLKHHQCASHQEAVSVLLKKAVVLPTAVAPPLEAFASVLAAVKAGNFRGKGRKDWADITREDKR